jgi:23S rRNA pseudouridine2605 synthase
MADPWKRRTLAEVVAQHSILSNMHPVGRLDMDTSGLLLFSSDGKLTQRLLNPDNGIPRVYEGIVNGLVDHEALQQRLRYGVSTADGVFKATLLSSRVFHDATDISYLNQLVRDQGIQLQKSSDDDPNYRDSEILSYVRVSVCEGKHRMVRRILHNAGHSVKLLHRRSYGNISIAVTTESLETNEDSTSIIRIRDARSIWPPKIRIPVGEIIKIR